MRKGHLEKLQTLCKEKKVDLVVFNEELSPSQTRNLENELDIKVIDRSGIILDIFAQRAKTKEAKVQVALAQSYYFLPRLVGKGVHLSRLGGGIGTRGPGEQALEYDRRRIRKRISSLKKELLTIEKERKEQRKKRKRDFLLCSIVGYTNAGKSTLLASLSDEVVHSDDKLFTTLDPLSRRVRIGDCDVIFTDTVGFIQDLPTCLFSAFRATLEEIVLSDIVLHIVDISNPNFKNQMASCERILEELSCASYPRIIVFNKIDLLSDRDILSCFTQEYPHSIGISAKNKENINGLFLVFLNLLKSFLPHNLENRRKGYLCM